MLNDAAKSIACKPNQKEMAITTGRLYYTFDMKLVTNDMSNGKCSVYNGKADFG